MRICWSSTTTCFVTSASLAPTSGPPW